MHRLYALAVGELLIDAISAETVESLAQARSLHLHAGGSTANFCRYLQRCGSKAQIVAAIGKDGFGQILLDKMQQDGLSTDHITQHEGRHTSLIVVGRTAHTPDFIPYRDADQYIQPLPHHLVTEAAWLHSTAFALSTIPARTHILQAFEQAANAGIRVSVDWNYSDKIWSRPEEARHVLERLQQYSLFLKFSLDDVSRYTRQPHLTPKEALHFIDRLRTSFVCLTCGADGVYFKCGDEWQFRPSQRIEVKNATGAGDSFWAGFVHACMHGADMPAAVENAIKTASLKLQGLLEANMA